MKPIENSTSATQGALHHLSIALAAASADAPTDTSFHLQVRDSIASYESDKSTLSSYISVKSHWDKNH